MEKFEHGSPSLGKVHRQANDRKYFCFFTGFLEGVAASGRLESGELEPLLKHCQEFAQNTGDDDAKEFVQDFELDLLELGSITGVVEMRLKEVELTCERSSLNRFMGYCAGIACDDLIYLGEAEGVVAFAREHPQLLDDSFAAAIIYSCEDALLDGVIDAEESKEICSAITNLVGDAYADTGITSIGNVPVFYEGNLPEDLNEMDGRVIVLTGNFDDKPRRILEDKLREYGAEVARTITSKTEYLIVGSEAARDWTHTHKGAKLAKALELQRLTGLPELVSEAKLKRAMLKAAIE